MVTLSSLKQAVRLQTQTDRSMRQAAFPLRRASGSFSGGRGRVGQLIRAAAVADSVQLEIYVRLRSVVDAVLGVLAVVAVLAVIGVTEAVARIVRLPVIRARRSVSCGNVPRMSAADTPVRPLAASTCSGLARNFARACGSFSKFRMKSSNEVAAVIAAISSISPDERTDRVSGRFGKSRDQPRRGNRGATRHLRGAVRGSGRFPIRGLGDFASAAPDPLIRKGGCPRQRDGQDRRLSFRTFPESFLDAPMGAGGARAGG